MAIPKPLYPIPEWMRNADPEIADFIDNTDVPGANFYLWNLLSAKADTTHPILRQKKTDALNKAYAEIKNDPVKWVSNNISVPITQEMRDNAAIGIPIQSNAFITNKETARNVGASQVDYLIKKNVDLKELESNAFRDATKYKLSNQILNQGTTNKWTGEGFGSVRNNALAMADSLMSVGIDDIRQFGQLPDGRYGNKTTGQAISTDYSRAGGNIWGGTFTGKDSTGFGVQFAPDGTPYFYTQQGASTSDAGNIVPIVSLGLALFAPGIGSAIGSALTGTAATTVASQVIGAAVVQGVLAEAQGGDFLDGAILGAVTAGVAPVVANTVGTTVADIMADSAIKNVVANAVASSASSAVTAALTGGDVDQAALTGALAGGIGSAGRDIGTALGLDTTPFSEQTQMLAAQEQGLGTSGATGANVGAALGVTAAGGDATSALTNALIKTLDEQRRAEATPISENIGNQPVLAPTEAEIAAPVAQETPALVTEPLDATISEPVEIAPPTPQEKLILDLISQELGLVEGGLQEGVAGTIPEDLGLQGGVAETIPNLDQETLDLITQLPVTEQNLALDLLGEPLTPEAVDITPVPEENLALDVLGQPLTSEAVDIEPIPQDPLLGLSAPAVGEGEQEAIDYQALEGLSDPFVGIGEQEAIDQANLDALDALSSAEVGQGEQEAINYQALEELSDPSIGLGEQEAIDRQALEELALIDAGQGEQDVDFQTTPYIPDFYISTGRRRDFGPTVTTLGQALSAPFFPSTPVSGLTSYRGAGEIESQRTGKPRRDVWNESSLRLKDALGL